MNAKCTITFIRNNEMKTGQAVKNRTQWTPVKLLRDDGTGSTRPRSVVTKCQSLDLCTLPLSLHPREFDFSTT